jgi:hypothetical protein
MIPEAVDIIESLELDIGEDTKIEVNLHAHTPIREVRLENVTTVEDPLLFSELKKDYKLEELKARIKELSINPRKNVGTMVKQQRGGKFFEQLLASKRNYANYCPQSFLVNVYPATEEECWNNWYPIVFKRNQQTPTTVTVEIKETHFKMKGMPKLIRGVCYFLALPGWHENMDFLNQPDKESSDDEEKV